jgi:hypothetical protein
VPYKKLTFVALPLGFTVACKVAEIPSTFTADPVVTAGGTMLDPVVTNVMSLPDVAATELVAFTR